MTSETAALCSYLGMHVDPAQDRADKRPSISYEARRRLFYGIMTLDKAAAIVTGRPPLISRRYISTKLPLDVTNEELMGSRGGLIEIAAKLDPNGWSRNGGLTPVKYMRARVNSALVRDEILEIALGGPNMRPSYEQLASLKEKELRQTAQLPEVLVWKPENIHDLSLSTMELFGKIMMRLEHLQNMFFIERLLGRTWPPTSSAQNTTTALPPPPPPPISSELLTISVEIVTMTITLWTHRDRVAGVQRDFQWIVSAPAPFPMDSFVSIPLLPLLSSPSIRSGVIAYMACALLSALDHNVRRAGRRRPLHGAAQAIPATAVWPGSAEGSQPHHLSVQHDPAAQPAGGLPRLDGPGRGQRQAMRRRQGGHPARA